MSEHNIKILKEYWEKIEVGQKTFEIRKNDRDYQVGDILVFKVINNIEDNTYFYPDVNFEITYIHSGLGLEKGYIAMSIIPVSIIKKEGQE